MGIKRKTRPVAFNLPALSWIFTFVKLTESEVTNRDLFFTHLVWK